MGQHIAKVRTTARTPQSLVRSVDATLEKKITSPRHPGTAKVFEKIVEENPHIRHETAVKHEGLAQRLGEVKVASTGAAPEFILRKGTKKMKLPREGELTYKEIAELLLLRKKSPEEWTEEALAEKYKLEVGVVGNIVNNYASFHIYKEEALDKLKRDYKDYLNQQEYLEQQKLPTGELIREVLTGQPRRELKEGAKSPDKPVDVP